MENNPRNRPKKVRSDKSKWQSSIRRDNKALGNYYYYLGFVKSSFVF